MNSTPRGRCGEAALHDLYERFVDYGKETECRVTGPIKWLAESSLRLPRRNTRAIMTCDGDRPTLNDLLENEEVLWRAAEGLDARDSLDIERLWCLINSQPAWYRVLVPAAERWSRQFPSLYGEN